MIKDFIEVTCWDNNKVLIRLSSIKSIKAIDHTLFSACNTMITTDVVQWECKDTLESIKEQMGGDK